VRAFYLSVIVAAGIFLLLKQVRVADLSGWALGLDPYAAHLALVCLTNALIAALGFMVYFLMRIRISSRQALYSAVFIVVVVGLVSNVESFSNSTWRQWRVPLTYGKSVRQELVLPAEVELKEARLYMDMHGTEKALEKILVKVNGKKVPEFLSLNRNIFASLGEPYSRYAQVWKKYCLEFRQWLQIPIDPESINGSNKVVVEVRLSEPLQEGQWVNLYGGYTSKSKANCFDGPSFSRISFNKFEYDEDGYHDRRIPESTPLYSTSTKSSFLNGNSRWVTDDLSSRPGIQSGAYYIRLQGIHLAENGIMRNSFY